MTTVHVVKGPQRVDKTTFMIDKLFKKQVKYGPMSYLLLGSSGGFLHDFRERYVEKADAIFNINFKVINQFVVEELIKYYPNRIHVDREMLSAFVLDVLSDNGELKELLSSGIGIVELFLSYFSIVNEQDPENVFAEADGTEDHLIKVFAGLYAKFRKLLEEKNMFSTYDAYRMMAGLIVEGDYELGQSRQFLFVDGFNDFPKPIRDFLTVFIPLFSEVYITLPTSLDWKIEEPSFNIFLESLQNGANKVKCLIKNHILDNKSPTMIDWVCDLFIQDDSEKKRLNNITKASNFPLSFAKTTNQQNQYHLIGAIVKDLVLKNEISLDEIGIVTRDIKKAGLSLSRVFENMGIPFRFEADVSILDSININRMILPFKVFYSGFEPEMILNFIETGFIDTAELSFATIMEIFEKAGLSYGKSFSEEDSARFATLKNRKEIWKKKLNRYEQFVQERINAQSLTVEEERDLYEKNKETIENIQKIRSLLDDVFETLGILFSSMRKREFDDYFDYFKFLSEKLAQGGLLSSEAFEDLSVKLFFEDILPSLKHFFVITQKVKKPMIRPTDFWKSLNIFLENKKLHSSEFIENKCLIMDLESSRYRKTDIRIYPDFLENYYPKIVFNKVYDLLLVNDTPFVDTYLKREERDFLLSLRNTRKMAFFIFPQGDINGIPYNRSFYVDRFLKFMNSKNDSEEKSFMNIEDIDYLNNYSVKDYLISKLDKLNLQDEKFIKLCSEFGYDWDKIKGKINLLKRNNEQAFLVEKKSLLPSLFGNTLSASKFGVLKKCYKDFFYQYILKVRTTLDEKEGFDYFVEGQILHSVLHAVFSDLTKKNQLLENLEQTKFNAFFNNIVVGFIQNEIKAKMFHPERILYEAEVSFFSKLIRDFLEKYRKSKYVFSNPDPEEYGPSVFIPKKFEIEITREDKIKFLKDKDIYFIGKIDRIDENQTGDFFIYDYKRSDSSADKKSSHQLMMYAYAANQLFKRPEGMAFLPVISKKKKITGLCLTYDTEEDAYIIKNARKDKTLSFQDLLVEIATKIDQVFNGDFNNTEKTNCYGCPHEKTGICEIRKRVDDR